MTKWPQRIEWTTRTPHQYCKRKPINRPNAQNQSANDMPAPLPRPTNIKAQKGPHTKCVLWSTSILVKSALYVLAMIQHLTDVVLLREITQHIPTPIVYMLPPLLWTQWLHSSGPKASSSIFGPCFCTTNAWPLHCGTSLCSLCISTASTTIKSFFLIWSNCLFYGVFGCFHLKLHLHHFHRSPWGPGGPSYFHPNIAH